MRLKIVKGYELPEKTLENAHKIAFLMQQYPDKKLPDVITWLELPAVDINAILWSAEDMGLITQPNKETGELAFDHAPVDGWEFGENVNTLRQNIAYALSVLARKEADLEEFFIKKWTAGYPVIDVLVAIKSLLADGILVEYEVLDKRRDEKGEIMYDTDENTPLMDTYIFYTLVDNAKERWGEKRFKDKQKEA